MEIKYIVDQWDNVIFIGTSDECLKEIDTNPNAVSIRDTRYRKSPLEIMTMKIAQKCFAYQIEDGGCGVVRADNKKEAEKKIREAYNVHGELSDSTEVWIGDPSWFEDFPDVFEIGE